MGPEEINNLSSGRTESPENITHQHHADIDMSGVYLYLHEWSQNIQLTHTIEQLVSQISIIFDKYLGISNTWLYTLQKGPDKNACLATKINNSMVSKNTISATADAYIAPFLVNKDKPVIINTDDFLHPSICDLKTAFGAEYIISFPLILDGKLLGAFGISSDIKCQHIFEQSKYTPAINIATGHIAAATERLIRAKESKIVILHDANEEWQNSFDALPDFVCILDMSGTIKRANKAMRDRFEASYGGLAGIDYREIYCGTKNPSPQPPCAAVLGGAPPVSVETKLSTLPGWYKVSSYPLLDCYGQQLGAVSVVSNITERKNAEHALRDSETRVRLLLDSTAEAIYGIDTAGNCTFANKSFLDIIGYNTEKEVLGKHMPSLVHHSCEDGSPVKAGDCRINQVLRDGVQEHVDNEVLWRKDGNCFPVEYWSHPVIKNNKVTGCVVTFIDITKRKQVEAELYKYQTYLEDIVKQRTKILSEQSQIIDQTHDSVISTDLKGNITSWNQGADRLFGYTFEEAIGKHISLLYPENSHEFLQNKIISPVLQNGEHHIEVKMLRKSGDIFYAQLSLSMLYGDDGSPKGMVGFSMDITTRKKAEQELGRLKSSLDLVVDSVFMFSPGTLHIFYSNSSTELISGYSHQEISRMSPLELFSDKERLKDIIKRMSIGKLNVSKYETFLNNKNGTKIPVEVLLQYISPPNEPARFITILHDHTEIKKVDRIKSDFISTVSHELRTPLTSIRGSLGLIMNDAVGNVPKKLLKFLRIASTNTDRLLLIINDILDIDQIESGKMSFHFKTQELMPIVKQSIQAIASYADQFSVNLSIKSSLDNGLIYADSDRLIQVMNNLLSNAVKFSPKGETVDITVARNRNVLRVSITDYGTGIPEELQPRLFDKFSQSDSQHNNKISGTGLGLAISKSIIKKHAGNISYVTRENIGTTMFIELPEAAPHQAVDTTTPPNIYQTDHSNILVIEDDSDTAALIRRSLIEAGYNVVIANTAHEAEQQLAENPGYFNLLTLDLILPDKSGVELLQNIKKNPFTKDIPIVVISVKKNKKGDKDISCGIANISEWIRKPIDPGSLVSTIKNTLLTDNNLPSVLHIEDDEDIHQVTKSILAKTASLESANNLQKATKLLQKNKYDLILLDIQLPDGTAIDIFETISKTQGNVPLIILSAQEANQEIAQRVHKTLIKSKTSSKELINSINTILGLKMNSNIQYINTKEPDNG